MDYPDGLAYAPATKCVFVSDEHGGAARSWTLQLVNFSPRFRWGGGARNTVYDRGSGQVLVAVHPVNELVAIDPVTIKIVGRYPLPGIENPHGIALDVNNRLAFVAGEENHSLAVFDLKTMKLLSVHQVGEDSAYQEINSNAPNLPSPNNLGSLSRSDACRNPMLEANSLTEQQE